MAFKLYSDAIGDYPKLTCDVCGQVVADIWSDMASGSPTHDGQTTDVTIHHAACAPPPSANVHIKLVEFLRLFAVQARIGDLGSSGGIDTVHAPYPTGKGFAV